MSALRGIGAAFEGFTRGMKLADEMETNEQNRKIRLAAEEREATKFAEEQRVREQRQFLTDSLSRMDGVSTEEQLNALKAEIAAGPKKKAKGVSETPAPAAKGPPPAAGVQAPEVPSAPPPATGLPPPAQAFAYGTNPAPALSVGPEGAAPAAQAPVAPGGQPQEPAPRMIPAYGTNKELREQIFKTTGELYKRLALLDGKYDLALKMPEIIEEIKGKEYDRTIGRSAVQARLGDVGSLRALLEKHGPELGFEGFKVPVGAAQSKNGDWEVLNANGEPTKITAPMLDYIAQKSASPAALVEFMYKREDEKIKQAQRDKELNTAETKAKGELRIAEARLEETRLSREDRNVDRQTRNEIRESEARNKAEKAGRDSLNAMIGWNPNEKTDQMLPKAKIEHDAKGRVASVANQLYNASIDPDQMTSRSLPSAVFEVSDVLTAPDNIRDRLNRLKDGLKPEEKKSLEAALTNATNRRADLASKVQKDDRGYFVSVNGIRVAMPKPAERPETPPATEPAKRNGVTPPEANKTSAAFRAGQAVRSGVETGVAGISYVNDLAEFPRKAVGKTLKEGASGFLGGASDFAGGIRTPE